MEHHKQHGLPDPCWMIPRPNLSRGGQARRHDPPTRTDQQVLLHARSRLHAHLPLHAAASRCTTHDLLQGVLGVAVTQGTSAARCAGLPRAPVPATIRRSRQAQLRADDLPALEQRMHAALAAEIPPYVWEQAREMAIACHDRPSSGTAPHATGWWVRGAAKAGTTRCSHVATASVLLHGVRVTLAEHVVRPTDATVTVLEPVLQRLDRLRLRPKRRCLDKGCASRAVIASLRRRQQPAARLPRPPTPC